MRLKLLIFLGSVRESTPPNPPRLGKRIALLFQKILTENNDVNIIDPLDYSLENNIFKPYFSYQESHAPEKLKRLAQEIESAHGYIMLSPEYNHSMSPALMNLLNHFGSSSFSFKPSAIATYSAGQWGGTRAGVNMRTFLSELGCLPVSAMIHIPKAQEVINENGNIINLNEQEDWKQYFNRTFTQLQWWAQAAIKQNQSAHSIKTPSFTLSPNQRNAP